MHEVFGAAVLGCLAGESGAGFPENLFEVFTPRQQCMRYEPDVVWMHVVSDSLIALAYFSIPLALVYFVRKRRDLAFNWMFLMFAAFILACGTTHVFGVWAIWQPMYRLDGVVKVLTACISVATAILMWPLLPKAVALPSPAQLASANEKLEREIAERREAQERLRRAGHELEQRVQDRTAELRQLAEERSALLASERKSREEAEHASRIKDEFVATLSHELRTPISAILGWTQQLSGDVAPSDLRHGLQVIERNTRAQMRMIEDLLDMSRIVSGKMRLDVQVVDLTLVIDAVIDSARPAADARGIRLRRVIDPRAGPVRGDANRLQQILWNLLSNAIKFTGKGGSVEIALGRVNSHVELAVADDGQGIDPVFLPHVFERFRQADASTSRAVGGLGLGLAIVKHLVELHGGTVRAHSPGEGKGATFVVSLPQPAVLPVGAEDERRHPIADLAVRPVHVVPSLAGVSVLVIDDDPDTRELLERVLVERGVKVSTAGSAAEGMEMLAAARPDVILSDIGMPYRDGYELIRSIRALAPERGGRVPAIALTAFARSEDRTRALLAGYQAHLAKPTDPRELAATIASLVGRTSGGA